MTVPNSVRQIAIFCLTLVAVIVPGCRMGVPIHVWEPPSIESTVGKKVVVSEIVGPSELASQLRTEIVRLAPKDHGRNTSIVNSSELSFNEEIRLVSVTDDEPSDIALSSVAKNEGFDYVMRGEILADRGKGTQDPNNPRLSVSWRLSALDDEGATGGMPVVVDRESSIKRYPDLAYVVDQDAMLVSAAVRDSLRLITPSVERNEVEIAIAYLLPGSRAVREGNIAALNGRWGDAKRIWSDVAEKHPLQVAAIHNLALAAAAEQDFSTAKKLARKAVRRNPCALHKRTQQWIELRQRDYHNAFGLPDPPEGWFITQ